MVDSTRQDVEPRPALLPVAYVVRVGTILAQALLLTWMATGEYPKLRSSDHLVVSTVGYFPWLMRGLGLSFLVCLPLVLGFLDRKPSGHRELSTPVSRRLWIVNLVLFGSLVVILAYSKLLNGVTYTTPISSIWPLLVSPLIWLGWLISVTYLIIPSSHHNRIFDVKVVTLFLLFLVLGIISQIPSVWRWYDTLQIQLLFPTVQLVLGIFHLLGETAPSMRLSARGFPVFGLGTFWVEIAPLCAGLSGILFIAAILVSYFLISPGRLRTLQMALIIFGACGAMFFLNAVRIVLLMYIGASWSIDVAVYGFHTNISMVFAAVVSALTIPAIRTFETRNRLLEKLTAPEGHSVPDDLDADLIDLIPLAILLGVSLITGSLTGSFFWLYPIHIMVAAIALVVLRNHIFSRLRWPSLTSIVAGIVAFALWMALAQHDAGQDEKSRAVLMSAPAWLVVLWGTARIIGSVVIVPIAEELAFRGGLWGLIQDRVESFTGAEVVKQGAAWGATSVAFGVLHGDLLAATLVGGIYGALRLHGGNLSDAMAAHATTNLLLALYVLHTGSWSYW